MRHRCPKSANDCVLHQRSYSSMMFALHHGVTMELPPWSYEGSSINDIGVKLAKVRFWALNWALFPSLRSSATAVGTELPLAVISRISRIRVLESYRNIYTKNQCNAKVSGSGTDNKTTENNTENNAETIKNTLCSSLALFYWEKYYVMRLKVD